MKLSVFSSSIETSRALILRLVEIMNEEPDRVFNIAVSGGNTPALMFDLWANEYMEITPWDRMRIYWVDAAIACQDDKSLKSTLTPIIGKLSDMRIVAAELDYLLYEPFKEFITMAFLLIGNIPLLYFLNKDWYDVLVNTGFGKGILAVCLLVLLISFAAVIRLTKPVEYKR